MRFLPGRPVPPPDPRRIVVPREEHDLPDWIRDAGRLATLLLEGHRLARSIGAEREMLEFSTIRVREGATTALDRPGQAHHEWLRETTLERLSGLRTSLFANRTAMARIIDGIEL